MFHVLTYHHLDTNITVMNGQMVALGSCHGSGRYCLIIKKVTFVFESKNQTDYAFVSCGFIVRMNATTHLHNVSKTLHQVV